MEESFAEILEEDEEIILAPKEAGCGSARRFEGWIEFLEISQRVSKKMRGAKLEARMSAAVALLAQDGLLDERGRLKR